MKHCWRYLFLMVFLPSMSAESVAVAASAGETKPAGVRFQRSNHLVADLDRALRVYRDVLKLELVTVRDLPAGGYAYDIFQVPKSARLRFAVLATESQPNVIALTEVSGLPEQEKPVPTHIRQTGLVLECPDYDGVFERAEREGLQLFDEDPLITADGRRGRQRGFLDHDGYLIVAYIIDDGGDN